MKKKSVHYICVFRYVITAVWIVISTVSIKSTGQVVKIACKKCSVCVLSFICMRSRRLYIFGNIIIFVHYILFSSRNIFYFIYIYLPLLLLFPYFRGFFVPFCFTCLCTSIFVVAIYYLSLFHSLFIVFSFVHLQVSEKFHTFCV